MDRRWAEFILNRIIVALDNDSTLVGHYLATNEIQNAMEEIVNFVEQHKQAYQEFIGAENAIS